MIRMRYHINSHWEIRECSRSVGNSYESTMRQYSSLNTGFLRGLSIVNILLSIFSCIIQVIWIASLSIVKSIEPGKPFTILFISNRVSYWLVTASMNSETRLENWISKTDLIDSILWAPDCGPVYCTASEDWWGFVLVTSTSTRSRLSTVSVIIKLGNWDIWSAKLDKRIT